jgi:pSer/pThr/pTyr-binding forkhead associated (FHA) protein
MSKLYILNGPEIGQSFKLRDGFNFVGRSLDNEIRLTDKTVSRKHLRIAKRGDNYLVRDLKSRNGTFANGGFISPGKEVEIREGVPIAIGITVICIGQGCEEQMTPFLDSIELMEETNELNRTLDMQRDRAAVKKLTFLYKVSNVLAEDLPLKRTLEKILVHIFELLKRIDRGVFVLVDPETEKVEQIIYKSNKPGDYVPTVYCADVVRRVISSRKPVLVSDARSEESDFADTLDLLKIESVLCVPLIFGSDVLGAIYVDSLKRPYGFRREDLALLVNLSQRIAPAIEDARFASEILEVAEVLSADDS